MGRQSLTPNNTAIGRQVLQEIPRITRIVFIWEGIFLKSVNNLYKPLLALENEYFFRNLFLNKVLHFLKFAHNLFVLKICNICSIQSEIDYRKLMFFAKLILKEHGNLVSELFECGVKSILLTLIGQCFFDMFRTNF